MALPQQSGGANKLGIRWAVTHCVYYTACVGDVTQVAVLCCSGCWICWVFGLFDVGVLGLMAVWLVGPSQTVPSDVRRQEQNEIGVKLQKSNANTGYRIPIEKLARDSTHCRNSLWRTKQFTLCPIVQLKGQMIYSRE